MSAKRDFYEILGVGKSADNDELKKAYRKLAMQFHPDRNPGDKASEDKFKEAAEAYDILSNPEKRAQYDRFGHQAFGGGGGGFGGGGFQDMNDIFSQFGDVFGDIFGAAGGFGGGRQSARQRNAPRRGNDLRYITEIELVDVLKGKEQQIEFETNTNCTSCNGSGAEKGSSPVTCKTCAGSGQVVRQQGFFTMATTCSKCGGTGETIETPCKPCKGQGRVKSARKIKVTIPAGVDNGTRLRISNEGEGGYKGGPNGDLFVEVRVKDHEVFTREEDHLFADLDVPYVQFLLGGEVTSEALDGDVEITIPRGTKPGERIKIAGRGIPSLRGSRRGDLYYTLNVEFPEKLTEDEDKLLRQIAEINQVKVLAEKKGLFGRKK
ncbi:MAG: molecular chaperone DnaJ [Bdellovibrionales bacterium RIFCSPHIGHO2_01_FULL_40_29]|nr:MAG: molecular chaperone DnaJ [Bdellovibrionales bacterium RIFCSPHIGHO2_01_FULL_40_29]OFZ32380.1 MAG: molecular chaperone DnaJ [Bdellovibrionales bacterium RIFCSPHIGHO2_02_FULL_40_15]